MDQYHTVFNATNSVCFDGRDISAGAKLLEMGNSLTTTAALITLLAGTWNNTQTFLLGDYAEEGDVTGIDTANITIVDIVNPASLEDGLDKHGYLFYDSLDENGYLHFGKVARNAAHKATGVVFEAIEIDVKDFSDKGDYAYNSFHAHFPEDTVFGENHNHLYTVENSVTAALNDTEPLAFVNYDTREKYAPGETMRHAIEHFDGGFGTTIYTMLAGSIRGGARGGGDSNASFGGIWAGYRVGIIPDSEAEGFEDITSTIDRDELES